MQDVNKTKERIVNIIKEKGPSLPVQISRIINVSPLFTSVFLSELREESKIMISNMKIGSSPLYFIQGQEAQLENFIEHLNQREKEAFFLIKKESVLDDEKQTPVTRVALRAIKDFAVQFKIDINNAGKIFWKYAPLSEEDANLKLQKILNPFIQIEKPKIKKEETLHSNSQPLIIGLDEVNSSIQKQKKSNKKSEQGAEFAKRLKEYLSSKKLEIIDIITEKKKEFVAKISMDTSFGKQEYYLVAKEKKKISETDLTLALQKAQSEKMPALIISAGDLDKKAQQYANDWRNLIKFEKFQI